MRLKRLFVVAFVLMMASYAPAFAKGASGTGKSQWADGSADQGRTMTRMSGRDRFRVSIRSNVDPLPLSRIHSWTVHIETPEGLAVEDAQIGVYGGMPAHKHGLPTKPRLTEYLGEGDYLIDGVKFSMPGQWELILIITVDGKRDKAKFSIDLP
jgi:hypothetical protein